MNTLNYIGCKHTLFNTLISVFKQNIPDMKNLTFLDLFAGTGTVGFNIQEYTKTCDANDLELYSYIINFALLKCNYSEELSELIKKCNELVMKEGLIYNNFSPTETCERMFFTNDNAKKADSIREFIETEYKENRINLEDLYPSERACLDVLNIKKDSKILDIGCALGSLEWILKKN